jgi:16S rRNA (guanine527-N7)-methyltransferase
MERAQLEALVREWDPAGERGLLSRLEGLVELWQRYGAVMNLSAARTGDALRVHVAQGLAAVRCASDAGAGSGWFLDVGAGAGFPGLVVAAVQRWPVALLEPREKRAAFLELAAAGLGCVHRVIRGRLEDDTWRPNVLNGDEGRENDQISVWSARAVFAPDEWFQRAASRASGDAVILVHGDVQAVAGWAEAAVVRAAGGVVRGFRRVST